jgi:hypothetical protein
VETCCILPAGLDGVLFYAWQLYKKEAKLARRIRLVILVCIDRVLLFAFADDGPVRPLFDGTTVPIKGLLGWDTLQKHILLTACIVFYPST